jgi:hypothetical protein
MPSILLATAFAPLRVRTAKPDDVASDGNISVMMEGKQKEEALRSILSQLSERFLRHLSNLLLWFLAILNGCFSWQRSKTKSQSTQSSDTESTEV